MSIEQQRKQQIAEHIARHKETMRECLGCESKPRLKYRAGVFDESAPKLPYNFAPGDKYEAFWFQCPGCGFTVGPFLNLQAALCTWHTTNTPGEQRYADLWAANYEKQMSGRPMLAAVNE